MKVRVTEDRFSVDEALSYVSCREAGAYVVFLGRVREHSRGKTVKKLVYEVYEEMALNEMEKIRKEALEKFGIIDMLIWHRVGELPVGEDTILVIAVSPHREKAFEACMWAVDEVKHRVPVWKREVTDEGVFWIEGERAIPDR
ncbi:MAG: molybdenum cofactor biosynthesis protein MoaE [Thermococcus sp.]|nr:molybdenum cofactor biosynthesis protein MoaE [Thermococcus sp.]